MSIRVDDEQRRLLKALASLEGRTMTDIVSELLQEYIDKRKSDLLRAPATADMARLMKVSEPAFSEWDNPEDDVYDHS